MANQCESMEDLATAGLLSNYVWCHYCEQKGFYKIVSGIGIKAEIMIDETKQCYLPFKPYNPKYLNNN